MTKQFLRCDNSLIRYEPKYQTETECLECGAIHKLDEPYELNRPSFHAGPFERLKDRVKCIACGSEELDLSTVLALELEKVSKTIPALFEKEDRRSSHHQGPVFSKAKALSHRRMTWNRR